MSQNYEFEDTENYLTQRLDWLRDGVEVVTGSREGDPITVFPEPTQPRAAAEDPGFGATQEIKLREIAGRFGIGGEVDVRSAADVELVEGGKPWKVEAETAIAGSGSLVYTGSPDRALGDDEIAYLGAKYGFGPIDMPRTEYDMARQIASRQPGFEPLPEDYVLSFGYALTPDHELTNERTGQLVQIGYTDASHQEMVYCLRVDREDYQDDDGNAKFRYRPDSAALMNFVADVMDAYGNETASVGMLTSSTYASRAVDAVRAGASRSRRFSVGMYGRQTLADTKGEPLAEPTAINQIPGELRVMAEKLAALEQSLANED
jgi:hypothetical protein